MKLLILLSFVFSLVCLGAALKPKEIWRLGESILTPESAYYDRSTNTLFISSIAGQPDEKDGKGNYIVSDWVAGKVYQVTPKGEATVVLADLQGAADVAFVPGKNVLIVPWMNEHRVTAYRYG